MSAVTGIINLRYDFTNFYFSILCFFKFYPRMMMNPAFWKTSSLKFVIILASMLTNMKKNFLHLCNLLSSQVILLLKFDFTSFLYFFSHLVCDFTNFFSVWNLLLSLGPQVKYDMLTSNAIQFLASVADRAQYKSLFEQESTLASLCEKIIVPNIEMR